jgi:hypothetical protein
MSLAFLFHYLMFNKFRMLVHPSSAACDLFVELFHGSYCSGSMCVGVTVWFACRDVASFMQASACIKDATPLQANHTVTPTHIEPKQYNP